MYANLNGFMDIIMMSSHHKNPKNIHEIKASQTPAINCIISIVKTL